MSAQTAPNGAMADTWVSLTIADVGGAAALDTAAAMAGTPFRPLVLTADAEVALELSRGLVGRRADVIVCADPESASLAALLPGVDSGWLAILDPGEVLSIDDLDSLRHVLASEVDALSVLTPAGEQVRLVRFTMSAGATHAEDPEPSAASSVGFTAAARVQRAPAARTDMGPTPTGVCPLCRCEVVFAPIGAGQIESAMSFGFVHPLNGWAGREPQRHGCPSCGATESDRLLWLHLDGLLQATSAGGDTGRAPARVLDLSPDRALSARLATDARVSHVRADPQGSLTDQGRYALAGWLASQASDSIDIAVCVDILDRVADDLAVLQDLVRTIRPGGAVLIQVPLSRRWPMDEATAPVDDVEAWARFGGPDRLRLYTRAGLRSRLRETRLRFAEIEAADLGIERCASAGIPATAVLSVLTIPQAPLPAAPHLLSGRPAVSIAIPSYQHAPYVVDCLDSILAQDVGPLEVVVTDDGSTDGTAELLRGYRDPRVKLRLFERNVGASAAVNDAIARSTAPFVAVMCSDDRFLAGKLRRQLDALESAPDVLAVFGQPHFVGEDGSPIPEGARHEFDVFSRGDRSRFAWLRSFFLHGNSLCHPTVLVRREAYERIGLYDRRLAALPDFDQWVRLCMIGDIAVLDDQLIDFRVRDGQANASARSAANVRRNVWEMTRVLRHMAGLQRWELEEVFPEVAGVDAPVRDLLAEVAWASGTWWGQRLSLDLTFDALPGPEPLIAPGTPCAVIPDRRHVALHRRTGEANPYRVEVS